jgi:uncharacterized phage protein gp47/JayE
VASDDQAIDYTSRDYASLRQSMLDDAAAKLPEWTSRSPNDFGVVLIEEFAYMGDGLSYYIDRVANEAFLPTATQRSSLLNIAAMLDYRPDSGQPSTVPLMISVVSGTGVVRIPAGSQFSSASTQPDVAPVIIFETTQDLYITQDPASSTTGVVDAVQGVTVIDAVGTSNGTQDQSFSLAQMPVIDASVQVLVDEGRGVQQWTFVEHLIDAGPVDRVFTTQTNASGQTTVIFGDDINGRIPFNDAVISVTYRIGGGTVGNVGPNTINTVVNAPAEVSTVTNLASAVGGTDPESNNQIRRNAPKSLTALSRAVTLEDYASLAYRVVGVAKANADALTPAAITVYVAPTGGGPPTTLLKQRVLAYLEDKKMVNAHISIADPEYVPISIVADIFVADQFTQTAVSNAVRNALGGYLDFDNVEFGQRLTLSDVYRAVMEVPGVQYGSISLLAETVVGAGTDDIVLLPSQIPTGLGGSIAVNVTGGGIAAGVGGGTGSGVDIIPGAPGAPVIDSVTCGVTPNGHQDTMVLHWPAATDATSYRVIVDFFNAGVYVGSQDGGSFSVTNANVTNTFVGADEMRVHIKAVRGANSTDGPTTTLAYPCG